MGEHQADVAIGRKSRAPLLSPPMAKSRTDADGVKTSRSKKSDKAHRNFELHGTYSSKHLRSIEDRALNFSVPPREEETKKKRVSECGQPPRATAAPVPCQRAGQIPSPAP